MQLSLEDVDLFFRLHQSLMFFVNQRLKVIDEKVATPEAYSGLPPKTRIKVHKALLDHRDLIDAFADENPFHFDEADLEIVRSWKHLVSGTFYAYRQLQNYMVFLSSTEPVVAYGVVALFDPFETVIGPYLPRMIETTLLPFKGRIVYDGLVTSYNITFGAGIKRRLNAELQGGEGTPRDRRFAADVGQAAASESAESQTSTEAAVQRRKGRGSSCHPRLDRPVLQRTFERGICHPLPQAGREAGPQTPLALASRQSECVGQRHRAGGGRGQFPARQEPDALYAVNGHRPLSRNQPKQRGGEAGGNPKDAENPPA